MKNSGFTIVELMVVLAILAILLSVAPPTFNTFIKGSQMTTNSNDLIGALNFARMEAIKRGSSVQLGQRDGSTWLGGFVVWVDTDGDGTLDAGEELQLWEPYSEGTSVYSTNSITRFTFAATGEVDNVDNLTLCDNRSGETGRYITILSSGAIYADEVTCV
tara:strand:- start:6723 stop:7205 length:483 start_codon:yes stop_codon:yes gene_type:complete